MKRILIVEDNALMRKLILNLFDKEQFLLDEAENGLEGLGKIHENHYDLIITDIVMPEMEGIEMIRHARRSVPDVNIIAITGRKLFYLSLAKKLGVQHVFTKPLDHQEFSKVIGKMLQLPIHAQQAG